MKYYAFYNPNAGNGVCEAKIASLKEMYPEESLVLNRVPEGGDYSEFLKTIESDDVIIICGGDGTLNKFANSLGDVKIENEVMYYATGTGNDFRRDVKDVDPSKPFSVKKYIEDLPTVEVNGKSYKFINGVGYGVDGYCCEVGDKLKAENKKVDYTAIAIKGLLFHHKPSNAKVTIDGVEYFYKKVWIAPTMNGKFYGGGIMPAPAQDRLGDGSVSVMIFHGTSKIRTLMIFPKLFKGTHLKYKNAIAVHTGSNVQVEFDIPTALQIDGETVLGVTSYKVTAKERETAKA